MPALIVHVTQHLYMAFGSCPWCHHALLDPSKKQVETHTFFNIFIVQPHQACSYMQYTCHLVSHSQLDPFLLCCSCPLQHRALLDTSHHCIKTHKFPPEDCKNHHQQRKAKPPRLETLKPQHASAGLAKQ